MRDLVAPKQESVVRENLLKKATKFNGKHFQFQNQFHAEINDNAAILNITKFSYLKELAVASVHAFIEGLPYRTEGCQIAKSILQTNYGKTSEIVTSHVKHIMQLPVIEIRKEYGKSL